MPNEVIGEKREGEARIRSSGGIPTIEETYSFLVRAESKDTSRFNVLATPGLPIVNQTFSSYGLTICRGKSATRREDQPDLWDVTCEFSSEVEEGQEGGQSGQEGTETNDPEAWVPVYETKFEKRQQVLTKDLDGKPIANSAGQPFENGLIVERHLPVWEFYQIESAAITDEQIIERTETINSTVFRGRAKHTLLLVVLSSVRGYYYGAARRLTQYRLTYDKDTWTTKRLDLGTVYKDPGATGSPCGAAGGFASFLDCDGNVILGPLDGSGNRVTDGSGPAVVEFRRHPELDFSTFLRT